MLALDQITKSYGTHRVLTGVTLHVNRGEILGYVGGNGAGKTTSMRVLLGVSRADEGRVTLDGAPIDSSIRARMGYMPEERGLYAAMRIDQQLQFFAELRGLTRSSARDAAEYWLERLGLTARRNSRLEDLSLGNQQRVQLAAALVHAPEALVLDEPFSGLDPLAVDMMADVLREEATRGVPVIFSSHQLDLVERVCDRVAILHRGQIVADGSVDELTFNDGHRYRIRTTTASELWTTELPPHVQESLETAPDGTAILRLETPELVSHALDTARRHGTLSEFRPWHPSLTDIYRETVDAPSPESTQEEAA